MSENIPSFNGGKMLHIFQINPENNLYFPEFTSDEAKQAFMSQNTSIFIKIDGSNGRFETDSEGIATLYQRYDDRSDKFSSETNPVLPYGFKRIPIGENPQTYETKSQTHSYYLKMIERNPEAKGLRKISQELYQLADQLALELGPNVSRSIELVGKKFQNTPGITVDASFVFHDKQVLPDNCFERTYRGVKEYLLSEVIEGIILEHEGKFWKIRANCFDKNCLFEQYKKSHQPKKGRKKRYKGRKEKSVSIRSD